MIDENRMSKSTITRTPKKLTLWIRQIASWLMERVKKILPYAILGTVS